MFTLTIETDNDVFTGHRAPAEVARILRRIADRLTNGNTGGKCMDANGNSVGTWELEEVQS